MDKKISFVRNFKGINGWEQVEITKEESHKIQEQLREFNNQIYIESMHDAHEILKPYIVPYSNSLQRIQDLANRLFEKRAINVLTAYEEYLKAKIERIRNGENE